VFCHHPPRRCPAERHPDAPGVRAAARRCQWDAPAASGSTPNAVFCHHRPHRCPAERHPDAPGVRAAVRRCQWDAPAASGSTPNAVFCHHPPRRRPAERLPDRPLTRHDRLRLSEPGCQQLPATVGRRPASPACRHSGSRPGGSGSHPCQSGWRSMSWLAPSVRPSSDTPAHPPLGVGGHAHRAGVPSAATDPSARQAPVVEDAAAQHVASGASCFG
jgi:hypothetical protein